MAEGERDIMGQIELGGKGRKANGEYQTTMSDKYSVADDGTISDSAKKTPAPRGNAATGPPRRASEGPARRRSASET